MNHELIAKSGSKPSKPQKSRRRRGDMLGILLMCAMVFLAFTFIRQIYRPMKLNYCEGAALKRLVREYEMALREQERLKKEIKLYSSKSGALAGARELGYVRPGETPVSIEEPNR